MKNIVKNWQIIYKWTILNSYVRLSEGTFIHRIRRTQKSQG